MRYDNTPETYYASFSGKTCEVYVSDRRLKRRFTLNENVVGAQVSGVGESATVAITLANGRTGLWSVDGRCIRQP